jgi:hypothetical protein
MKLKLAGIKRQSDYSPNHVENDSLILLKTGEELRSLGAEVIIYNEESIINNSLKADFIFSMAQGPSAQKKLFEIEKEGTCIINSPKGVTNCYRVNMVKNLQSNSIPFPKSIIIKTDTPAEIGIGNFNSKKIWLKRGDVHAVHREDVTIVYSEEEKNNVINEFARRNINQAVLQEHVDGDLIKFYSVRDSDFFYWYQINGKQPTKFDLSELKFFASRSAEILELYIYGGDAIISNEGKITIIDINDWPSFAPIRDKASKQIAQLIFNKACLTAEKREKLC